MANLTLSIDDDVLRRARIRALEQGTSVNALVRRYLEGYAGAPSRRAMDRFLEFTADLHASSGRGGRTWTREDVYEERLGRYR